VYTNQLILYRVVSCDESVMSEGVLQRRLSNRRGSSLVREVECCSSSAIIRNRNATLRRRAANRAILTKNPDGASTPSVCHITVDSTVNSSRGLVSLPIRSDRVRRNRFASNVFYVMTRK